MRIVRILAVAALALLVSAQAFAQTTRPERPYRGLFGGGYGNSEQMLSLSASFGGGYDGNIAFGSAGATFPIGDPRRAIASTIAMGSAGLSYTFSTKRISFDAYGSGSATDYPSLQKSLYSGYGAGTGGALQLSSRTSLSFSEAVTYYPLYVLPDGGTGAFDESAFVAQKAVYSKLNESLAQDLAQPAAIGLQPTNVPQQTSIGPFEGYSSWFTNAGFSHQLTRRVSLSVGGGYSRYGSTSGSRDLSIRSAGATIDVAIAKGLSLRLGDGVTNAYYVASGTHLRTQNPVATLNFNRALTMSLSKRMTLSFGLGSSILTTTVPTRQTQLFITGNAELAREIGRSWEASIGYNRAAGFVYGFLQPVVSDAVSVNLGGLVNRKLQFHSSVSAWWGAVGLTLANNRFTTYSSGAGISWAFTRELALGLDYAYYRYTFDSGVDIPTGLGRHVNRQSVRVSINLWEPLFHRLRRPNATR